MLVEGTVTPGGRYTSRFRDWEAVTELLNFEPYRGTLNLKDLNVDTIDVSGSFVMFKTFYCKRVTVRRKDSEKTVQGYALWSTRNKFKRHGKVDLVPPLEIIAPVHLRSHFKLKDGDKIIVEFEESEEGN